MGKKRDKEFNAHSMWPNHVKSRVTGLIYDLEMPYHEASVYKKRGETYGGIIFCYNNFLPERKKPAPLFACDKDGNELPVSFYTTEAAES